MRDKACGARSATGLRYALLHSGRQTSHHFGSHGCQGRAHLVGEVRKGDGHQRVPKLLRRQAQTDVSRRNARQSSPLRPAQAPGTTLSLSGGSDMQPWIDTPIPPSPACNVSISDTLQL